ncbi:MAG: response regulator transcription factor [Pseudomonadota bacterium]
MAKGKGRPVFTRKALVHGVLYGGGLAVAAFALAWLEYRYTIRSLPTEIYVGVIALAFTGVGLWAGQKMNPKRAEAFEPNEAASDALGLSERERRVLELIADGQSNKEIARTLGISPNTVKTHLSRLFSKLDVSKRTLAVRRARELLIIP